VGRNYACADQTSAIGIDSPPLKLVAAVVHAYRAIRGVPQHERAHAIAGRRKPPIDLETIITNPGRVRPGLSAALAVLHRLTVHHLGDTHVGDTGGAVQRHQAVSLLVRASERDGLCFGDHD